MPESLHMWVRVTFIVLVLIIVFFIYNNLTFKLSQRMWFFIYFFSTSTLERIKVVPARFVFDQKKTKKDRVPHLNLDGLIRHRVLFDGLVLTICS